jgi:hypothetical protein
MILALESLLGLKETDLVQNLNFVVADEFDCYECYVEECDAYIDVYKMF